jgi:hypothetical protein
MLDLCRVEADMSQVGLLNHGLMFQAKPWLLIPPAAFLQDCLHKVWFSFYPAKHRLVQLRGKPLLMLSWHHDMKSWRSCLDPLLGNALSIANTAVIDQSFTTVSVFLPGAAL